MIGNTEEYVFTVDVNDPKQMELFNAYVAMLSNNPQKPV